MTRIREEARGLPLREAVVKAVGRTGSTVTSAGLILGGTFIVLAAVASGTGASQMCAIGVGLAAGILMDTFLVRTLLVPATVILLGRINWWPTHPSAMTRGAMSFEAVTLAIFSTLHLTGTLQIGTKPSYGAGFAEALICVALAGGAWALWRSPARGRRAARPRLARHGERLVASHAAMAPKIVLLPGDGIGPEIMRSAIQTLDAVGAELDYEEHVFGGASIDAHGTALTDETLAACRSADAVLLAAVGGPKWDTTDPDKPRPEQGLLGLRKGLGLFANLRPVKPIPALYDASPLKRELIERTNLTVVRELTGGIYFGEKTRTADRASDDCVYTRTEIERIARVAFEHRPIPRHQRRQGQRARDEPPVARGGRGHPRRRVPQRRARASAGRQRRHEAHRRPSPLRGDPHREHVRRHPQRRGGDAHRLDRDAARARPSGARAPACSNRCTDPPPTSPARARPTRSP